MSSQLDLKAIERRAFRSTYQDGLQDIYLGLVVLSMSIFVYRPADGYGPRNLLLGGVAILLSYLIFWAGKKFITLPRLGQVRFGAARKQRKTTMVIVLSLLVLLQAVLVGLTTMAWFNPEASAKLNSLIADHDLMDVVVAALGALIVGSGMILTAFFSDFPRGYYIALMMSLAVFLMIYTNQPLYAVVIGLLILLPGVVLFVRFLQTHSLHGEAV